MHAKMGERQRLAPFLVAWAVLVQMVCATSARELYVGVDDGPAQSTSATVTVTSEEISGLGSKKPPTPPVAATVPTPLAVGIDDVGWKRGWSTADTDGPWRAGMPDGRWMVWADYEALVYVAEAVNARLQCLFVMCEFDRSNICAEYPTTTQDGNSWDNSALVDDNDFVIMDYVKDNAAHIEFGLHGVGHEHWEDGVRTRAEFANQPNGNSPWPYSDVNGHMECFQRLIEQYGISFPESFVPPSHAYYYDPCDPNDTGGLMNTWTVKYGIQLTTYLTDHGLPVLPRKFQVDWDWISRAPTSLISTNYCWEGAHWTNFLEEDPANNHTAGDKWINWFNMIKDASDRYVPKNTAQTFSQYLYQNYAAITIDGNTVEIETTGIPNWAYNLDLVANLVLKLPLEPNVHVSSASFDGGNIACYYEDRDFGYIVLPEMDKSTHTLTYSTGASQMGNCVLNDGTYNVHEFGTRADMAKVSLEMYGTQDVKIKLDLFEPWEVQSTASSLMINALHWDDPNSILEVNVTAADVQGVKADIVILSKPVGDITGDGRVDFTDFAILAGQWGQAPGIPSADIYPLFDGDGCVDTLDLSELAGDWLADNNP
jgi:hypothetical protein